MLQKILRLAEKEIDKKERDSEEFKAQSQKCAAIYDELHSALSEEQRKKLLELDFEYFMCAGQWRDDGFQEGMEGGFKLAVQLILDSLK